MLLWLFLAIAWIIFPFIVISKFNELLKVARELADDFDDARKRLKAVTEMAGVGSWTPIAKVAATLSILTSC